MDLEFRMPHADAPNCVIYFPLNIPRYSSTSLQHPNMQANRRMQEQLEAALRERDDAVKSKAKVDKSVTTPTPKVSAPSPASSHKPKPKPAPVAKGKARQAAPEQDESEASDNDGELSTGAKLGRLRRLCERKPSGKLNVPQEVHDRWAQKGKARDERLEELEACDWDPDKG